MILFGDYHTHTQYSDGKSTILQNAQSAKEKGLKELAITEHGFAHKLHGIKREDLEKYKQDIQEAEKQVGIKIYRGIEANYISSEGDIDINEQDLDYFEIIGCGFHKTAKPTSLKEKLGYILPNNLGIFAPCKRMIEKNSLAIMKALDKYPISFITHMGVGNPVNVIEVAKHANALGTYVELNGKRIAFTQKDIDQMVENKIKFIVNSDAHSASRVGECNKGTNLILKYNIPTELIVNFDKIPEFRKIK